MKTLKSLLWLLPLIVQNLVIFRKHYFYGVGFPFDFGLSYYGIVAYWTTCLRSGIFPDWVPFESMGYPLALNQPAGIFYPPFWIFPLLGVQYSLHAAVCMQCLHVLVGAFGCYQFAGQFSDRRMTRLAAAITFQLFGGFYSNSEHADIIRAFALLPWLFYSLTNDTTVTRLQRRNFLIPFIVCLVATGAYPGNLISYFFLSAIYLSLLLITSKCAAARLRAVQLGLLFGVGLVFALPQLGLGLLFADQLTRSGAASSIAKLGWDIRSWPTLIFSWDNRTLPSDTVMLSVFISCPALVCACCAEWSGLKKNALWLIVGLIALILAPGTSSVLYRALVSILPPLQLSRFPASDYRAVVFLSLIIMFVLGFDAVQRRSAAVLENQYFIWVPFTFALVTAAGMFGFQAGDSEIFRALVMISVAVALVYCRLKGKLNATLFASFLCAAIMVDAWYVIGSVPQHWNSGSLDAWYAQKFGFDTESELPLTALLQHPPVRRPARVASAVVSEDAWRGYLDGSFQNADYTGFKLLAVEAIERSPVLKAYMDLPWTPIVSTSADQICAEQSVPALLQEGMAGAAVTQTSYGIDDITYQIHTTEKAYFIENEVFFPGWKGTLTDETGSIVQLTAVPICGAIRGWLIPRAGTFGFAAKFETPHSRTLMKISGAAVVLYVLLIGSLGIIRYARKDQFRPALSRPA